MVSMQTSLAFGDHPEWGNGHVVWGEIAEDDAARIDLVDERGGGGGDDDDGCVWLRVERGEVALCEIFAQR